MKKNFLFLITSFLILFFIIPTPIFSHLSKQTCTIGKFPQGRQFSRRYRRQNSNKGFLSLPFYKNAHTVIKKAEKAIKFLRNKEKCLTTLQLSNTSGEIGSHIKDLLTIAKNCKTIIRAHAHDFAKKERLFYLDAKKNPSSHKTYLRKGFSLFINDLLVSLKNSILKIKNNFHTKTSQYNTFWTTTMIHNLDDFDIENGLKFPLTDFLEFLNKFSNNSNC